MEEIQHPHIRPLCRNTDHWEDEILFGKCRTCGGEITIRKADIPMLARDIEFGSQLKDLDEHDCKLDEWGTGHCDHPSHHYGLVDNERAETDSEAYRHAH